MEPSASTSVPNLVTVWFDTGLRFPWLGVVAVAGGFMGGELGGFGAVAASFRDVGGGWWLELTFLLIMGMLLGTT